MAFARYYTEQINRIGKQPRAGAISELSTATCRSCEGHETTAQNNVANKRRFDGDQFKIRRTYMNPDGTVGVVVDLPRVSIRNEDGSTHKTFEQESSRARVYTLDWTSGGWRVGEIQFDLAVTS